MKIATKKDLYSLNLLNNISVQAYKHLTYPIFRSRLQSECEDSIIAIGAELANQPVGLAMAHIIPDSKQAKILSIYVLPEYRQQGIGGALLERLSQQMQKLGRSKLELEYTAGAASTMALESLLSQQGWSTPQAKMLVCYSSTEQMQKAPWLYSSRLPKTFSIFPLVELTKEEYQIIQQKQARKPWYPEILSPFAGELPVEPLNSLGLRYQGEVVGWMATHRIAPNTIRYTKLFVREDLQRMGRAISLIAEAIKIQLKSNISQYTCATLVDNQAMVNFVQRRLKPFLTQVRESRQSYQLLTN